MPGKDWMGKTRIRMQITAKGERSKTMESSYCTTTTSLQGAAASWHTRLCAAEHARQGKSLILTSACSFPLAQGQADSQGGQG